MDDDFIVPVWIFLGIILVGAIGARVYLELNPDPPYKETTVECIDGVEYLKLNKNRGGSLTPHLKPDGSPYTCTVE
jgi:hypothetical protein